MKPEDAKILQKAQLIDLHGTVEKQKDNLVQHIMDSFTNPRMWPMTDDDRIRLLKTLYNKVLTIKHTEQ